MDTFNFSPDAFLGHYRQLKRATVARSALEALAFIFLIAAFAFWAVCFWQLLTPPALLSLQSVNVAVLALVFSLAAPLLWSALVPTTPAGQLLQKTQWRTVGFTFIIAAAVYLSWIAWQLLEMWLASQPGVQETGLVRQVAVALVIAFILLPALSWTQLTPERWLEQIRQSHAVRKLEMMQSGELAILKSRLIWAETKALAGFAKLLPEERQQLAATMQGLMMGIADTQRNIARMYGMSSELDSALGIMDDHQITEAMRYVTQQIAAPAHVIDAALDDRRDRAIVAPAAPPRSAPSPAPPQTAAVGGSQPQYAAEYTAARSKLKLSGTWSAARLGDVLDKSERTARTRIEAWERAGLVAREQDGRGAFYFTEEGR